VERRVSSTGAMTEEVEGEVVQRRWSDLDKAKLEGGEWSVEEEEEAAARSPILIDIGPDPDMPLWAAPSARPPLSPPLPTPLSAAPERKRLLRTATEGKLPLAGGNSSGASVEGVGESGAEGGAVGDWRALSSSCAEVLRAMSPPPSFPAAHPAPLPVAGEAC
jgi:hypothetical protein